MGSEMCIRDRATLAPPAERAERRVGAGLPPGGTSGGHGAIRALGAGMRGTPATPSAAARMVGLRTRNGAIVALQVSTSRARASSAGSAEAARGMPKCMFGLTSVCTSARGLSPSSLMSAASARRPRATTPAARCGRRACLRRSLASCQPRSVCARNKAARSRCDSSSSSSPRASRGDGAVQVLMLSWMVSGALPCTVPRETAVDCLNDAYGRVSNYYSPLRTDFHHS